MLITGTYEPNIDRYDFDFDRCASLNGWAQYDTDQDASYFGIWINPLTLTVVSFMEGDVRTVQAETTDEFVDYVRSLRDGKIDDMCQANIFNAIKNLGLTDLLHDPNPSWLQVRRMG